MNYDKDQTLRLLRALSKRIKSLDYVEDALCKQITENLTHLSIRLREANERQELDAALAERKKRRRSNAPTRLHKVKREDTTLTKLLKRLSAAERERIINALSNDD